MATPHPLIARLAAERKERGITAAALARRAGYSDVAVRNWETGRSVPDLDRLEDYAAVLGMQISLTPLPTRKDRS
jgi:transcriptional regulator with XRE-family HTH domain